MMASKDIKNRSIWGKTCGGQGKKEVLHFSKTDHLMEDIFLEEYWC